ncbi:cation:proton antiporter [Allokutzneria sp. A3M-2-11 16]|uniref:cation:proton antiporter domain-containing protein n=1 Tax=Allokutzneria sp. A3M-2-11 16 TaxID=2962043 RepID=UPI0020B8CE11|nr:cation:proton antiporter [Allokutzneria sp. A3M-2-11 16]MCP3804676.1 cation:proton antiporter [Allokutzneria sp. A3M-2-11 16]
MTLEATKPGRRRAVPLGALGSLIALGVVVAVWGPELFTGAAGPHGGFDPIARFLLAVAVIVLVCHLIAALLRRFGQPPVVGEILGGLLLGPSVFGLLWPSGRAWLFPAEVLSTLQVTAQLGLVTFMFLLGCELRLDEVRRHRKAVWVTVAGSMGLPFAAGVGVALAAEGVIAGRFGSTTAYALFFGLAMAITALPVLARILVDLGLDDTAVGRLALTCAAVGDGAAWAALTVLLAVTGLSGSGSVAAVVGLSVEFILVTVLCVRPALAAVVRRCERTPAGEQLLLPLLAAGAIGFASLSQVIGLHPVIGAFLFGVVVPRDSAAVERISKQLQGFAVTILLPLFFAGVGLSTSLGLLSGAGPWLLFLGLLAVASVAKFVGAGGGAKLAGMSTKDSLKIGTLMNCRGVTELVIATIGLQYKLVNELGFTILVLIALITTAATGPLMQLFSRGAHPR